MKCNTAIFATWGNPRNWAKVNYVVEIKKDEKREVREAGESFSSTKALKKVLEKVLRPVCIKIFILDTLYLDRLLKSGVVQSLKRAEIVREVRGMIGKGGESEDEVEEFREHMSVMPGVISYRDGADIYTWRGGEFYDVLVGGLTLEILDVLEKNKVEKVVVDTTHGINYSITALVEAARLASAIYLLKGGDVEILHYNADPVVGRWATGPAELSLKIHLISQERLRGLGSNYLALVVENLATSLQKASDMLNTFWKLDRDAWKKALAATLLLFRGAPQWAVRIAHEVKTPTSEELRKSLLDVKIQCENGDTKTVSCEYKWGERRPTREVVVVSEIIEALKKIGEEVRHDIHDDIECALEMLKEKAKERSYNFEDIIDDIRKKFATKDIHCYDGNQLGNVVERIYPTNIYHIFSYELREIKDRMENGKTGGKDGTHYLVARRCGLSALISSREGFNLRNFYAHAGLSGGVLFVVLSCCNNLCICPLDWEDVVNKIGTAGQSHDVS